MSHQMLIRRFLICIVVVFSSALLWGLWKQREGHTSAPLQLSPTEAVMPVRITGFSYKQTDGPGHSKQISIGEFAIRPRSIMGFRVKSFNEAIVKDLTVTIISDESSTQPGSRISLFGETGSRSEPLKNLINTQQAAINNFGIVSRCVIEGLTLDVFHNGNLVTKLSATRGIVDLKRKTVSMNDVVIAHPVDGSVVRGPMAVWDEATGVLRIRGQYVLEDRNGITTGQNLETSLGKV